MSTLRQARDRATDRERTRGRGRGAVVQYYDDMGFSSTEQGHERFLDYKQEQAKKVAEAKAKLNQFQQQINQARTGYNQADSEIKGYEQKIREAQSQIDEARSRGMQTPNLGSLTNQAWQQAKGSDQMVKARVIADGKVQGVYYIPKEAANNMAQKGMNAGFVKNNVFNVDVKQGGRTRGQEIHDMLRTGSQQTKTQFQQQAQREIASQIAQQKAQAAAEISRAQGEINTARSQVENQRGQLIQKQGEIQRAEASIGLQRQELAQFNEQEQQYLQQIAKNYNGKIERMSELMSGLDVKDGGGGDTLSILDQLNSQDPTLTEQIIEGENIPVAEAEIPQDVAPVVQVDEEMV
jgi:chromosome segregation ATPase